MKRQLLRIAAERLPEVDLHAGVGDVVLAADDMGDAALEVVDHAGEGIERGAVGAQQHRVRQARQLHDARAEHAVQPFDLPHVQLEAPMRQLAVGQRPLVLLPGHLQRAAVVDRRALLAELLLALVAQLLLRFEAGVEPAGGLQPLGRRGIERHAVGLAELFIPVEAEPAEILLQRLGIFGLAALGIGVVEAQQHLAAELAGEQPVDQRGAGIADMEVARRRGGEAEFHDQGSSAA